MSKPRLAASEYRMALIAFLGCFGLLFAAAMTQMPLATLTQPTALIIIAVIAAIAAIIDLVIKYRRLQRGITTEMVMQQARTQQSKPSSQLFGPWQIAGIVIVTSLLVTAMRFLAT